MTNKRQLPVTPIDNRPKRQTEPACNVERQPPVASDGGIATVRYLDVRRSR